jgi:hypothetical protein
MMHPTVLIEGINSFVMENGHNNKKKMKRISSKSEEKITPLDRSQINELLSESIHNYVVKLKKDSKEIEEIVSLINSYVSEFLEAFMLLGYDMRGNPICIHHANNQKDADALNSLLNRILFNNKGD